VDGAVATADDDDSADDDNDIDELSLFSSGLASVIGAAHADAFLFSYESQGCSSMMAP
jgi:hypothetical protein